MTALNTPPPAVVPAAAPPLSPALRSLQILEIIEQRWEDIARSLREHVAGLRSQRAFYDGAWVFGLRVGGRSHEKQIPFSRIDVQIHLDTAASQAELTSCITVRNRDQARRSLHSGLDDAGLEQIGEFLEGAAFTFVDRYFDRS